MSKLWSIPIISGYLYGVTILTSYGYNSYFNIPSSFIEASIKENFIYFFQLFQLASYVAGLMRWWMWFVVILAIVIITLFYNFSSFWRIIFSILGTTFLILLLLGSFKFGGLLAASTTNFYTLSSNCSSVGPDKLYVIPNIYNGKAILVPINEGTMKMKGSFLVKDTAELGCEIEYKNIGEIGK